MRRIVHCLLTALFCALQGLGPLLHAHVEGVPEGSGRGLHLHLAGLSPKADDHRSASATSQAESAAIELSNDIRRDRVHAWLADHRRPCIGRPTPTPCLTVRAVSTSAPPACPRDFDRPPAHAPPLIVT